MSLPLRRLCKICGWSFIPPKKNRPGIYCSAKCRNTGNSRTSVHRRAANQRGTGTKGYVKELGRHQHRVVAEQKLGRALLPGEIVHHLDGDKKNNDPANLAVMTQGEHMRTHGLGVRGMKPAWEPWKFRGKKERA